MALFRLLCNKSCIYFNYVRISYRKTIEEAKDIMDNFNNMLNEKDYDSDLLEEACCFKNTSAQPSRIGCATIGWRGFWNAVLEIQNGKR